MNLSTLNRNNWRKLSFSVGYNLEGQAEQVLGGSYIRLAVAYQQTITCRSIARFSPDFHKFLMGAVPFFCV